eukprot:Clim_evm30s247 gene=Clim_evmTU30s247
MLRVFARSAPPQAARAAMCSRGFSAIVEVPSTAVPEKTADEAKIVPIAPVTGIPEDYIKRTVTIFEPTPKTTQSGTFKVRKFRLEFDTQQKWQNPLMGWSSTGDAHSQLHVEFDTLDGAIKHAVKNGWKYEVIKKVPKRPRKKAYGDNFSWASRTRVTTK